MALDAFPRAARRDRHLLMVVAGRTAGRECVAEPEGIFLGNRVGDVRERGGALVGRNHQVGVVLVVAHDHAGRNDLLIDDVVGHIQQSANQRLIAGDHLGLLRFALGGQAPHDESALGADRHDDRVLDLLRFHQSQYFGAEILASIRPTNAAAGHVTHAQMHAFHARREYEYLEQRLRQRQLTQLLALDLEGQVFLELARGVGLEGIGAHRGGERIPQGAQDAILVGTGDFLERGENVAAEPREGPRANRGLQRRVESRREQVGEQPRNRRVVLQHLGDVALAERQAGLQQVAAIRAQHRDHAPRNPGRERQLIEAVVVHAAGPHRGKCALDFAVQRLGCDRRRGVHDEFQILDPAAPAAGEFQFVGPLRDDFQAHVLEHGQQV